MKARTKRITVASCVWLLMIGLPLFARPERSRPVHVNQGDRVDFRLKYLRPTPGADPKADTPTPWGRAVVTRDDKNTTIDIQIGDMPRNPGRYYLYLIQPGKRAVQMHEFGARLKLLWEGSSDLDAFWVVVSTERGRATIEPDSDDVVMISIAP